MREKSSLTEPGYVPTTLTSQSDVTTTNKQTIAWYVPETLNTLFYVSRGHCNTHSIH